LAANDPKLKIFENVFLGSSTGHRTTICDQIWWKSAVAKLPKGRVVYQTKKTRAPRDSSQPPFWPKWADRAQNSLNVVTPWPVHVYRIWSGSAAFCLTYSGKIDFSALKVNRLLAYNSSKFEKGYARLSSQAMHASDVWIDKLAMFISQRCALCCWSAVFQRCRRRRRLPPVHILPPGGDPWHEQRRDFGCDLLPPSTERCSHRLSTIDSSPNPVQRDVLPHRHSQLTVWSNYQTLYNDFFEVYITKTVNLSQMQTVSLTTLTIQFKITWSVILRSDWSIASQLTYTVTQTL